MTKFSRIFGAILAALARGFSDRHFERGEGPRDAAGHFLYNFTLDNSNLFLFPLKVRVIGRQRYIIFVINKKKKTGQRRGCNPSTRPLDLPLP